MSNEITPTFHGIDDTPEPCYFSIYESKISDKLRLAEEKLQANGYKVSRCVRVALNKPNECYELSVYGYMFQDLDNVRKILGDNYKLCLNPNNQQISIR